MLPIGTGPYGDQPIVPHYPPVVGSAPANYSQLPALTSYQASGGNDYNGSVLTTGVPPYSLSASYYTQVGHSNGVSQASTQPSPIQYQNFPPTRLDGSDSASPSYHDTGSMWHKAGDAPESNVRGSTASTAQAHNFERDEYGLNSTSASAVAPHEPANGPEGLLKWLAVSQNSNPVNSILRLGSQRRISDHGVKLSQQQDDSDSYKAMAGMLPIANSGVGRYAKVEQTWYSRLSSHGRWPGAEKRWYDILQGINGNLFECVPPTCSEAPKDGAVRVSEACRARMMSTIYPVDNNPYNPTTMCMGSAKVLEDTNARFPTCAAFDVALDKYFSSFLREAPFLHMPVFSISTCHPLLLFVMSCIGFGLGKTTEGCHFVQSNFSCVRDRILAELERKLTSTTKDAMSIFAASFLFLKLAALINDRDHLSPCQLLYISLISLAQMHGMFSEYGKRTNGDMFSRISSLQEKWMAWGRVESLKRISVSLMRLDSAYATFLRSAPIVRVGNIEVLLPCDDALFAAKSATEWYSMLSDEHLPTTMPAISRIASIDQMIGHTFLNYYALHAVLNYLQLRSLDAHQKLLDYQAVQPEDQFILVPYEYYCTEPSLHDLPLHIVAFVDSYQSLLSRFPTDWQKTNCLVFWHFLCLSLTANHDLFEIAVGREGPKAAASAIHKIAIWARTAAARRALIHAASIYRLLSERQQSEMNSLYAAFATFAGALVITLYTFAEPTQSVDGGAYELTSDVEWKGFGLVGFQDSVPAQTGSAAENFILHGGPCVFNGHVLRGFPGARYLLEIYADMLKSCGRYNYRSMSQILFMMSDLLRNQ